nr:hypothetical protein Iba_chr14aCG5490 [Ipomoea batatas]GMD89668.1 hypothetical protein Iba_chr14dCG2250 [Ipomoea batatas]
MVVTSNSSELDYGQCNWISSDEAASWLTIFGSFPASFLTGDDGDVSITMETTTAHGDDEDTDEWMKLMAKMISSWLKVMIIRFWIDNGWMMRLR